MGYDGDEGRRTFGFTMSFDPDFDDTQWTEAWLYVPIAQPPPGLHPSGYRLERRLAQYVEVFDEPHRLTAPMECRLLFDPGGKLWMSDTPQERIMMYNNGLRSRGRVLVGGLGLGLYPQFAALGAVGQATHFTVVERSPAVREMVEPTLRVALDAPLEVHMGDVSDVLAGSVGPCYDTIFLDTWEMIDAANLPMVNQLRRLAMQHLAPGGRVLLWGYRWMVRLFEQACGQLLAVAPGERRAWLAEQTRTSPRAAALLTPVVDHFGERRIKDLPEAIAWCRQYIVKRVEPL